MPKNKHGYCICESLGYLLNVYNTNGLANFIDGDAFDFQYKDHIIDYDGKKLILLDLEENFIKELHCIEDLENI